MPFPSSAALSRRARHTPRRCLALALPVWLALGALAPVAGAQPVATPFSQSNVPLASLGSEVRYTIDLGTLAERPRLIVEADPDPAHADMELELEITGCTLENPVTSFFCPESTLSTPRLGTQSVEYQTWRCEVASVYPAYVGDTCEVRVRALDFGSAGAPATVDIAIRSVTDVPTSTISAEVTTSVPTVEDFVPTTTTEYFDEGQNFRWLYDLDADRVLFTPIQGRCEWSPPGGFELFIPYTYQFQGNPGYAGLDCCTWQIDSITGATGAGQAIFFVNVDSSNPANQPGDLDLDGIKDLCDNCPSVPNGPLVGTCTAGSRNGQTCQSNQQCIDGPCSLAQDDQNRDGTGNACVPEPGAGAMLTAGLAALSALARRRASPSELRASC